MKRRRWKLAPSCLRGRMILLPMHIEITNRGYWNNHTGEKTLRLCSPSMSFKSCYNRMVWRYTHWHNADMEQMPRSWRTSWATVTSQSWSCDAIIRLSGGGFLGMENGTLDLTHLFVANKRRSGRRNGMNPCWDLRNLMAHIWQQRMQLIQRNSTKHWRMQSHRSVASREMVILVLTQRKELEGLKLALLGWINFDHNSKRRKHLATCGRFAMSTNRSMARWGWWANRLLIWLNEN